MDFDSWSQLILAMSRRKRLALSCLRVKLMPKQSCQGLWKAMDADLSGPLYILF